MKFYLSTVCFLPLFLLLTGCQTVSQNDEFSAVDHIAISFLPLAQAEQIDPQDEVDLLRLNQLITEQKEAGIESQARLFYERGLLYDRMGLGAHSRYNFSQAISVDPNFAPAYNTLGLYLMLAGAYGDAFEAFDSALELSDKMHYSYLHRAVGLYEIQRYRLASEDIELFYSLDMNDPYRNLWRYIINSKIDPKAALIALQNAERLSSDKRFAWSLVDVIAGRTTENQFLQYLSYGHYTNKELAQRFCEAYFYLGHWYKLSGDLDRAVYYFKLSTATNIHDFIEYKYSLIELASIRTMLSSELKKEN